jgi:hypothetical protein
MNGMHSPPTLSLQLSSSSPPFSFALHSCSKHYSALLDSIKHD